MISLLQFVFTVGSTLKAALTIKLNISVLTVHTIIYNKRPIVIISKVELCQPDTTKIHLMRTTATYMCNVEKDSFTN